MIKEIYIRTPDDPNYDSSIIDFKSETEFLLNEIRVILQTNNGDVFNAYTLGVNLEHLVFNTVKDSIEIERMIREQISMFAHIPKNLSVDIKVSFGDSGLGYDYAVVDIIINGYKCMGFLVNKDK